MKDISIRIADLADRDAVSRLIKLVDELHAELLPDLFQSVADSSGSQDRAQQFIEKDDADIIVAELDGQIVGYISLQKAAHPPYPMFRPHEYAYVDNLMIGPNYRSQGIGRLLMDAAQGWALNKGLYFLQTTVWMANRGAKNFYDKQGFKAMTERLELDLRNKKE